jgi:hypothetical protein
MVISAEAKIQSATQALKEKRGVLAFCQKSGDVLLFPWAYFEEFDDDEFFTGLSRKLKEPLVVFAWGVEPVYDIDETRVDYNQYINSDEWRAKATAAKERASWRCQVCNRSKEEVTLDAHHRTYERLGFEYEADITVLCRGCHGLFHEAKKNGRLSP